MYTHDESIRKLSSMQIFSSLTIYQDFTIFVMQNSNIRYKWNENPTNYNSGRLYSKLQRERHMTVDVVLATKAFLMGFEMLVHKSF